jgi:DNA-directed RNA polymerase specialized sigma24 family protein
MCGWCTAQTDTARPVLAVVGVRGDDEFVEFAQANSARLQRAAYLLTGDRHQAEDAAQAALVRVYAA